MKQWIEKIRSIPRWGWAIGLFYFALQYGLYRLGAYLSRVLGTVSYAFEWKIAAIDDLFPVVPIFSVIYLFSYVFWICAPAAASLTKKRNFINYIAGLSLAYLIGFLFFIFLPTYMDRVKENLMTAAAGQDLFSRLLRTIYEADGSAMALVSAADYQVKLHEELFPDLEFAASFAAFMAQETIPFTKETKKGTTELDLKPMIMDWRVDGPNGRELFLHVTQGSKNNLKPETVLAAFAAFAGQEFDPYGFSVCRSELYMEDGRTLAEAGQSI